MAEWLRQLTPTQEVVISNTARSSGNIRTKSLPIHMVRTRTHPIPDQSLPGSTRTVTDVKAAGHLSKSGIQNSDSTVEQPGQRNVKLLEEQPQKKKWTVTENKERLINKI